MDVFFIMLVSDNYNSLPCIYTLGKDGKVTGKRSTAVKLKEAGNNSFRDSLNISSYAQQSEKSSTVVRSSVVADLSERYAFYSTGDPEQDHQIALGLEYKKSCFDFTHAKEFDDITEAQKENGFDGMSRAEKYAAIYEKYQYCYGENFLDATAIEYVDPPLSEDAYLSVIHKFNKEIAKVCGSSANIPELRKKALYGDMSDDEIRQSIMDKYSADGTMSQRELFKAANEMDMCGIGGGMRNALNPIGNPFIYQDINGIENQTDRRESMLDMPVTAAYLKDIESVYKNRIMVGGYVDDDLFKVLGQIMANYR